MGCAACRRAGVANRESGGFVFGLSISAAGATVPVAVHVAQSEPGESEQAEGDRDADLVQQS